MKRYREIVCVILMLSILFGVAGRQDHVKAAENVIVQITEGTLGHAINRTMSVGEERTGWKIGLNQGRKVGSATWTSSDLGVMTVDGSKEGATVKTYKEGTAVLTLTVVTDQGETVSDQCLVSSVTTLDSSSQAAGYVKDSANLYRGARTSSKVRNTASAGQELKVIALCSDFYRVRLPEGFDFNDTLNQDTAYVLRPKVEVPAVSVAFTNESEIKDLKVGDKIKATYSVLPELVTSKKLVWKSSDTDVVSVDEKGLLTARKAGTATVTLTEENSSKKASVKVIVSDILVTSLEILNTKEIKDLSVGGTVSAQTELEPKNATKKKLVWKSSNTKVLAVDDNGMIKALAGGTATVTVLEMYSGLTASVHVNVGYSLAAPKGTSKPKIKLKKSTDFRGNYISWNKISHAKYYRIYIEHRDEKKKKYISTNNKGKKIKKTYYNDTKVVRNQKYRYCVVAYDSKDRVLTKKKEKADKITVKATAPDLSVSVGGPGILILNWNKGSAKKRKGVQGYKIYRSDRKGGKYAMVKQIKKKSTLSWTDSKLQGGKTYYYRIRAYGKYKKKRLDGAYSGIKSACTISAEKNWEYFNRKKDDWKGICLENALVTEQQSTERMKSYYVEKDGQVVYPYIKYHMTADTLYIHVYVRFYTYDRVTGTETKVSGQKGVYEDDPDRQGESYKSEFIKGVTSSFSTLVKGNKDDFEPGISFHTKLILHDQDAGGNHANQEYLGVSICGDCDCENCLSKDPGSKESSNYWFHAYSCIDDSVFSSRNRLHIADNEHLINNGKSQDSETVEDFRSGCAHEMGHILGLGDGYEDTDNNEVSSIRMTFNDETCFFMEDAWSNLMLQSRACSIIKSNDMEMMLQAYGFSFGLDKTKNSVFQYYRNHYWNGTLCHISTVIRKKENEKKKENENEE